MAKSNAAEQWQMQERTRPLHDRFLYTSADHLLICMINYIHRARVAQVDQMHFGLWSLRRIEKLFPNCR